MMHDSNDRDRRIAEKVVKEAKRRGIRLDDENKLAINIKVTLENMGYYYASDFPHIYIPYVKEILESKSTKYAGYGREGITSSYPTQNKTETKAQNTHKTSYNTNTSNAKQIDLSLTRDNFNSIYELRSYTSLAAAMWDRFNMKLDEGKLNVNIRHDDKYANPDSVTLQRLFTLKDAKSKTGNMIYDEDIFYKTHEYDGALHDFIKEAFKLKSRTKKEQNMLKQEVKSILNSLFVKYDLASEVINDVELEIEIYVNANVWIGLMGNNKREYYSSAHISVDDMRRVFLRRLKAMGGEVAQNILESKHRDLENKGEEIISKIEKIRLDDEYANFTSKIALKFLDGLEKSFEPKEEEKHESPLAIFYE